MPSAARHSGERPADRVRRMLLEIRDRARVSDPGLGRLRQALSAVVCVGTALPVQLGVGHLLGYPGKVGFAATMFGAVVAMLGSNALVGAGRWDKVRTAVFFPLAVLVGLVPATATAGRQLAQVVGFTVMLFLAVYVRRFGTNWFFYGFMAWMGFFFATFLQATWSLVPELVVASVVSTIWVLLLTTTVLWSNPRAVLRSTMQAFFASGRSVARECVDLLEAAGEPDVRRRRAWRPVAARLAVMSDASLLAEGWMAEPDAVPEGWSAAALRRRMLETQQAVERFSGASRGLLDADPTLRDEARRTLDHLARRRDRAALASADRLDAASDVVRAAGGDDWWPARHVAYGVREFLRFDAAVHDPPEVDPGEEEFESATALVFGGLAGAPAVARDVTARGRWNPVSRQSLSTRQAVQVALAGLIAIGLGTALSPTRYYWAVIAAFVTFTGTGTRSETFLKGAARIGGTLLGIVAAIGLAHVTAGHTVAIFTAILASIFFSFYLMKVSYAAGTFFITVLLGQLYTVLGTFSDSLLALRLGETAVGAAAGVVVALLFAPLSTRDTVRTARNAVYDAMGDLLDGCASYAEGTRIDVDALVKALDDRARRLSLVARPLTRTLVLGNDPRHMRRRLAQFTAAVSQCRALSLALQRRPLPADPADLVTSLRSLSSAVEAMKAAAVGEPVPLAEEPLVEGGRALFAATDGDPRSRDEDPVVRHLHHLAATLAQLASGEGGRLDPVGTTTPQHRAALG